MRGVLLTLACCPAWIHMTLTEPTPHQTPQQTPGPLLTPQRPVIKIALIQWNRARSSEKWKKMTKLSVGEQTYLASCTSQICTAHMVTTKI